MTSLSIYNVAKLSMAVAEGLKASLNGRCVARVSLMNVDGSPGFRREVHVRQLRRVREDLSNLIRLLGRELTPIEGRGDLLISIDRGGCVCPSKTLLPKLSVTMRVKGLTIGTIVQASYRIPECLSEWLVNEVLSIVDLNLLAAGYGGAAMFAESLGMIKGGVARRLINPRLAKHITP